MCLHCGIDRSGPVTCLCVRKPVGDRKPGIKSGPKADIWPHLEPRGWTLWLLRTGLAPDKNHKTTFVLFYESVLPTFRKEKNKTTQVRTKTNKRYSSKNIQYICCINLYRMSWTFSFTYTIHKGQNRVTFTSFMILRKCPLRQPHFMYIFTHKPDKTALGCTLRGHDEIQMPCIKIPEKCLSVR